MESEGGAIRVGRVVVVDITVVVDIHEVGRVASIGRGSPPVVATTKKTMLQSTTYVIQF